ncbi:MAG: exodeoxyribonuclease I [Halomonadaceae bacterium]|nr:MAG: exodeoxyribonuclease I [Halomonadaceae bacterium]
MVQTFFWHDYETFGTDTVRDRPSQFAGIRTDAELNIIEEPVTLYCRPADDYVPDPGACLVTGITPQEAHQKGLPEAEFIARIHQCFSVPETCVVGYNSLRFDDEITRQTLYRNLLDPYAREWKNGNSRWDIIDMVRLCYALRPEGIVWPEREGGLPSFRLEELTRVNGIAHESAHDAMSDVHATIAMARLIREKQPRLYEFVLNNRDKRSAQSMLDWRQTRPVFHVSSHIPASLGCCAMVLPLAPHPVNKNATLVVDLRQDPTFLLQASVEEIRARVFTRAEDLPAGTERVALKAVHANKCPVLAPGTLLKTMDPKRLEQFQLRGDVLRRHLRQYREAVQGQGLQELADKISAVFADQVFAESSDPDEMLYGGGFISPQDRQQLEQVLATEPELLAEMEFTFQDQRLYTMVFRYRARNYPDTLTVDEQEQWETFRQQRLLKPGPQWRSLPAYFQTLEALAAEKADNKAAQLVLHDLQLYGESLIPYA